VNDHSYALLLSVRPRYAELIMQGTKLAEVRRQRPNVESGTFVIIYATQPIAAVVGFARISNVHFGTPSDLWTAHRADMGVSQEEFDDYLAGATTASLLMLSDAQRLSAPLTLDEMRTSAAFRPPRSYRYISHSALSKLVTGHPAASQLLTLLDPDDEPPMLFPLSLSAR